MQENKTVEKVRIAVVGEGAAEFVEAQAGNYPNAELIPMKHPPTEDMPYVYTDSEKQRAKNEADRRRRREESPDPVENHQPMNRRERRRQAALNKQIRRSAKR